MKKLKKSRIGIVERRRNQKYTAQDHAASHREPDATGTIKRSSVQSSSPGDSTKCLGKDGNESTANKGRWMIHT
jgi:hypothetical protein